MDDSGCSYCYDAYSANFEVRYETPEDAKLLEQRLASYRKRLASWEKWAEENREEIKDHLAAKTAEKEAKLSRLVERSHKTLKREQKTLEKRLKSLEKRLQK